MSSDDESFTSTRTVKPTVADEAEVQKRQRKTLRTSATLEAKKVNDFVAVTHENVENAMVAVAKLKRLRSTLAEIDKFLLVHGGYANLDQEIQRAEDYQDSTTSAIEVLTNRLRLYELSEVSGIPHSPAHAGATSNQGQTSIATSPAVRMKRPQLHELHLTTFDGNPMHFMEFWEDFKSGVDSRTDYTQSDKFKYLKGALRGEALAAVGGYLLTENNYEQVKEELHERFGDPEVAIFAHFQALLDIQPATHDLKQLARVRDVCETHVRSLIALRLDEATFGRVFCPIILSKLPKYVKVELHRKKGSERWSLQKLRELLKEEIMARDQAERLTAEPHREQKDDRIKAGKQRKVFGGTGSTLVANSGPGQKRSKAPARANHAKYECVFCNGSHYEDNCSSYPTVTQRTNRLISLGRCFVCLEQRHLKKDCEVARSCFHCKKSGHHRCLCFSQSNKPVREQRGNVNVGITEQLRSSNRGPADERIPFTVSPSIPALVRPANSNVAQSSRAEAHSRKGHAVMETCMAPIQGERNCARVRFLFDTASTRSFIKKSTAHAIGAKYLGQEKTNLGRLGDAERQAVSYGVCEVDVCLPDGNRKPLLLSQIETISTPIRLCPLDSADAIRLQGVFMADGLVQQPCEVQLDVLIGLDYYHEFVGPVVAQLDSGLVLKTTIVGHMVTGFQVEQWSTETCAVTMLSLDSETCPDTDIERLWALEELGIKDCPTTNDDDRALEIFNNSIKFEDGRYQVKWLFREGKAPECDNRKLSEGRLRALYRRLKEQPELLTKYNQTIQDQVAKGVVEPAPDEPDGLVHYIPHHHVLKETSATTKLRIVYDASAKTRKEDHSLNECLYRGPVILADLGGMIMRIRLSKIAMAADIEKAFLQIGLQKEDRDATRFLWLRNPKKPPSLDNVIVLRFSRVPFGFATSTFLLDGTIAHHLKRQGTALALEVLSNLFVDNIQGGRETEEESIEFYRQTKTLFSAAALNLREWYCNLESFMRALPESDRGEGDVARFLGLGWDIVHDQFNVTVGKGASADTLSKRGVLKGIASAFDPCGWFAPLLCQGKVLMQEIWKTTLDWDDQLPEEMQRRWQSIQQDLGQLTTVKIPRYVGASVFAPTATLNLHCFCDASGIAYGAAVYLTVTDDSTAKSVLMFAKSSVRPLQQVSIPRLELIAATLGATLLRYVRRELRVKIEKTYLWTDSKCVLYWILKESVKEKFVENRLESIRGPDIEFRYVPTAENPADIASRGTTLERLLSSRIWWNGPPWILLDESRWPEVKVEPNPEFMKKTGTNRVDVAAVTTAEKRQEADDFIDITRFSSLLKLIRVTVWCKRFVKRLKREPLPDERPVANELRESLDFWLKRVQRLAFSEAKGERSLQNTFHQLSVYKDNDGFLRCRGRFEAASIPFESMNPLLLPKNHALTELIIEDAHRKVLHSGVKHTLAELRQNYWIIHGRSAVRSVLYRCRKCRRYQGEAFRVPPPPPLPNYRVSMQRPFSQIGLDYAGPVFLKDNGETVKSWICLFTCCTVRAIHLELVANLSTETFLLALRRFSALYGVPDLIVSDNAAQFKSANSFLQKLVISDQVQDFSSGAGITWKFIPEKAPWMGGFFERMVAPVKKALRRCVGNRLLDSAEFQTVLYEICATVNSRPLTVQDTDEVGEQPLTPNHFLLRNKWQFSSHDAVPTETKTLSAERLIVTWKRLQNVLKAFWIQWQREYLLELRQHFWPKSNPRLTPVAPREGQVVLVSEKNVPRGTWKLARITKLLPSSDGLIRTAEVRFSNRRISRRAIKLLHPLESSEEPQPIFRRRITPIPPDADEEYDEEFLVVGSPHSQ